MQERTRRLVRVIAILAVAAAAGQMVQSRNSGTEIGTYLSKLRGVTHVAAGPGTEALPLLSMSAALPPLPGMAERPAPGLAGADVVRATLPGPDAALPVPALPPVLAAPAGPPVRCPDTLVLRAAPQATIGLTLSAPCRAGERVVVRHGGLAATAQMTAEGGLNLALPALDPVASVTVLFADGSRVVGKVDVPDAADFRRFAVQWQGDDEFQLHAFEDGADFGDPGHVWAGAPHLPAIGTPATGGWMMSLGDSAVALPLRAAVYTFPRAPAVMPLVVIEAPVTEGTCGREMLGELLSVEAGRAEVHDLTLAMPDCSAVGDILVLKNLAPALKIATN